MITLESLKQNVRFFAKHVMGKLNKRADNLSRGNLLGKMPQRELTNILRDCQKQFGLLAKKYGVVSQILKGKVKRER